MPNKSKLQQNYDYKEIQNDYKNTQIDLKEI